jgi:hypothetical protein
MWNLKFLCSQAELCVRVSELAYEFRRSELLVCFSISKVKFRFSWFEASGLRHTLCYLQLRALVTRYVDFLWEYCSNLSKVSEKKHRVNILDATSLLACRQLVCSLTLLDPAQRSFTTGWKPLQLEACLLAFLASWCSALQLVSLRLSCVHVWLQMTLMRHITWEMQETCQEIALH